MYLFDITLSCDPKGNIPSTFIGFGELKRSINCAVLN